MHVVKKGLLNAKVQWIILFLAIILSQVSLDKCAAQAVDCNQTLSVETDSATQDRIIRSRKNIVISDDGKTGFVILGLLLDSTFILSIKTVGGDACVNEGDSIQFMFADGSELKLNNMGTSNCEANSSLYFSYRLDNLEAIETLSLRPLSKLTVWAKQTPVTREVNA